MRLIDGDNVKENLQYLLMDETGDTDYCEGLRQGIEMAICVIDDHLTVEAEPIRHGHWIMLHKTHNVDGDNDYDWRCSECNHVDCHNINVEVPYCWYCGARMDEVVDAEDENT